MVALGGVVGASARYGIEHLWPVAPREFPWTTLIINVIGSALLAALLSAGVRVWRHPLDVLFAGSGVLGGFTTFSTFSVQTDRLLADGRPGLAGAYVAATVLGAATAAHVVRREVLRRGGP